MGATKVLEPNETFAANPLAKIANAKGTEAKYTAVKTDDGKAVSPDEAGTFQQTCKDGLKACCKCSYHGSPWEFISYNLFDLANMVVAMLMFALYGFRTVIEYSYETGPVSWDSAPFVFRDDAASDGRTRAYMSGPYGSGEFLVTLIICLVASGIFFSKLISHMFCPDRQELKCRADYDQLESYRSSAGSSAE